MATNKNFIGIDLGTSSIKVILVNLNGDVLAEKTKSYPLKAHNLEITQNCNDWFDAFVNCIQFVMTKHSCEVEALSFSGQMHGLVLLDKAGTLIGDSILWNDQRSFLEVKEIKKHLNEDALLTNTGNMPIEAFILPKLMWLRKNDNARFQKIKMVLSPKDYLIYKITNRYVTDFSDASGSGMFDVKNKKWSELVLKIFNIKSNILPQVQESYTSVGRINASIVKLLKFKNRPKVIVGAGDQAANAIGLGVVRKNQLALSLGTSACIFAPSDHFATNKNLHSFNHCDGKYHLMGVSQSGGGSIKWFFEEILASKRFSEIEKINFYKPSNTFFLPYLTGERHPIHDPLAKALFFGMDRSTNRNDMIRSVLEGVVFSINHILSIIKKTYYKEFVEMIVGGGGGNNVYWMQTLASMLNMKVKIISGNYGGAMGAAIIAMVGAKAYSSYAHAIKKIVKVDKTFYPNPKVHAILNKKYHFWLKIYPKVKSLYQTLQQDFY